MSCTRPDFLTSIFPTRPSRRSFRLQQFSSASSSCLSPNECLHSTNPWTAILSWTHTRSRNLRLPQSPSSEARTGHPLTAPLFSLACALWWGAVQAASQEAARRTARHFCRDSICAAGQTEPQARGEEEVWKWPLTSLFQFPPVPVLLQGKMLSVNTFRIRKQARDQLLDFLTDSDLFASSINNDNKTH